MFPKSAASLCVLISLLSRVHALPTTPNAPVIVPRVAQGMIKLSPSLLFYINTEIYSMELQTLRFPYLLPFQEQSTLEMMTTRYNSHCHSKTWNLRLKRKGPRHKLENVMPFQEQSTLGMMTR